MKTEVFGAGFGSESNLAGWYDDHESNRESQTHTCSICGHVGDDVNRYVAQSFYYLGHADYICDDRSKCQ